MCSNKSRKHVNNWTEFETIKERMTALFDNPLMADIVFKCKSNERLMAHKLILSSGSQVFHQLFNQSVNENKWKISSEDNKQCIEWSDCELKHIKPLIRFLYTDQLDIDDDNVSKLVYWSKKLGLKRATELCLQFIVSQLNDTNCLKWWQRLSSNALPVPKLMDRCLQMVSTNASHVFRSHDILSLSLDQLIGLLSRNDLNINEFDLFKAAIRWAQQKCLRCGLVCDDHNLRQVLGMGFDLIRFPVMASHEFGLIVSTNPGLFAKHEMIALISYINSGVVLPHRLPFSSRPRIPVCGDIAVLPNRCYQPPPLRFQTPINTCLLNPNTCCQRPPIGYPQLYPQCHTYRLMHPYSPPSPPLIPMLSPSPPPLMRILSPPPGLEVKYPKRNPSAKQMKNRLFRKFQKRANCFGRPKQQAVITDPNSGLNVNIEELVALPKEEIHSNQIREDLPLMSDTEESKTSDKNRDKIITNCLDSDNEYPLKCEWIFSDEDNDDIDGETEHKIKASIE